MILDTTLNGRPCTAMYMTRAFEPVDNEADAELVKVRFMDEEGGVLFLVPQREEETPEPVAEEKKLTTELRLDKAQAQALKDRWHEQAKGLDQSAKDFNKNPHQLAKQPSEWTEEIEEVDVVGGEGSKPKTLTSYRQKWTADTFDESQVSREGGKFSSGGGDGAGDKPAAKAGKTDAEKYATERLVIDGPGEGFSRVGCVKDKEIHIWGASHQGSSTITGQSASVMGIEGYTQMNPSSGAKRLADKFLDTICESDGSSETLYHGFNNVDRIDWKVGDTMKLPLTASAGHIDDAMSYGISYNREDNSGATVFEFPKGTKMAGYSRWDREMSKEFGYEWSEAIVAGEFKITGMRTAHERGWKGLPITVVQLEPINVFDRQANEWRKL